MLKVLLAPELPDPLLSAPRRRYRNASQLAAAANVSIMSAFRLVQQLQLEGYLDESDSYLNLVRREHLFSPWQAAALDRVEEVPMPFLLRGDLNRNCGESCKPVAPALRFSQPPMHWVSDSYLECRRTCMCNG